MSNPASTPVQTSTPAAGVDRRKNPALRELIDEMLASIRSATNNELWTPDERTQYERELGEIMARVRSEAVRRPHPSHA
jgi:hypothetical protein